jgi:class 3 adenylate cyclase
VITQTPDGRCFVRDVSRNGTRLDGRRLTPNLEVEMSVGQVVSLGKRHRFRLEGEPGREAVGARKRIKVTAEEVEQKDVTVLVGDIRDYTVLVQDAPAAVLQRSVSRLFEKLEREVIRHAGTVKEHQGDALFAYWEEGVLPHAELACRGALALEARARELGMDRDVWALDDFPLRMDWALASGPVVIHSYGGDHPSGLSVIGEPVVLAFRIEKLATDETGPIVACPQTRRDARGAFVFESLGARHAKGFAAPVEVFALRGRR